jgi:hypothetical protein
MVTEEVLIVDEVEVEVVREKALEGEVIITIKITALVVIAHVEILLQENLEIQ